MTEYKVLRLFVRISSTFTNLTRQDYERLLKGPCIREVINAKFYTEGSGKRPSKEEQIDTVKMPGFVHPQTVHEEGHFTQKAKQQLEELKKRLDKPTIENTEKKE